MKRPAFFKRYPGLPAFVLVLVLFLGINGVLIVLDHRHEIGQSYHQHVQNELDLMAFMVRESVLRNDLATVESFLNQWGASRNEDVAQILALAPNGFEVARYVREPAAVHFMVHEQTIRQDGKTLLKLVIHHDLKNLEAISNRFAWKHARSSLLLTTSLAFMLWLVLRKTAVKPLEAEIGKRQRAEERLQRTVAALKASEERFRSLVESTSDWIWEMDTETGFTYASPQVEKILGYQPQELLGKRTRFDLMPDEEAQSVRVEFNAFIAGGKPFDGLVTVNLHKDGHRVVLESSGRPFRDGTGRLLGYRGIDRDISERQRAEMELRRARDEADAANQAKSAFLAAMSHDIRTPMNAILGMGDVLRESGLNPQQTKALEVLTHSGENLLALINDILDLSKVEAGQLQMENVPFDLHELTEGTHRILAQKARAKRLEYPLQRHRDCPNRVIGDPQRLRQILLNLLGNAIKFTDKGAVMFTIEPLDETLVRFTVADSGIGIAESALKRIFDPFRQAEDSTSRRFGGTGLGLAICSRLATAMGGRIDVESRPDQGSSFHFTARLPRLPETVSGYEEVRVTRLKKRPSPADNEHGRPLHILLVDDAEENRIVINAYLKNSPHTVRDAGNGEEGVDRFKEEPFDLVLMDIRMPILDGFEATKRIRAWERGQRRAPTPIIALTANAMREDIEKTTAAGFDLHLSKPIGKQRLLAVLNGFRGTEPAMPPRTAIRCRPGKNRFRPSTPQPWLNCAKPRVAGPTPTWKPFWTDCPSGCGVWTRP